MTIRNNSEQDLRRFNLASKIQSMYLMDNITRQYETILDLCAGDGDITVQLSECADVVYALDHDIMRANRITASAKESGIKNIRVNCCPASVLPYQTGMFDLVVCNSALEHIAEYALVLGEIQRVLRKDGILLLTVPNASIQFGDRFAPFWKCIVKLPKSVKKIICRNEELADFYDIKQIQQYNNVFFKHVIGFKKDRLLDDLSEYFTVEEIRYYMNWLGAFGHDCSYYFRWGKQKIHLNLCLMLCRLEHAFIYKSEGKGMAVLCRCKK